MTSMHRTVPVDASLAVQQSPAQSQSPSARSMTTEGSQASAADDALAERRRSPRRSDAVSREGSLQRAHLPPSSPRGRDKKKIADLEAELATLRAEQSRHATLNDREAAIARAGVRVIFGAEHATHEIMDAQQAEHRAQQVEVAAQVQSQALQGQTLHAEQQVASQRLAVERQQQLQQQQHKQQQQSLQQQQ